MPIVMAWLIGLVIITLLSFHQFEQRISAVGPEFAKIIASTKSDLLIAPTVNRKLLTPLSKSTDVQPTYIFIVNEENHVLQRRNPESLTLKPLTIDTAPSNWATQEETSDLYSSTTFIEYREAFLDQGELAGFVRIGYKHGFFVFLASKKYLLLLSLLPALLVTSVVLIRHRKESSSSSGSIVNPNNLDPLLKLASSASVKTKLNSPVELDKLTSILENSFRTLKKERFTLYTSAKILAYQKTSSESILRSIPDGVIVLDESGCTTYVNKPFLQWYQLKANDVIGKLPYQWCERTILLEFLTRYRGVLVRRSETGKIDVGPPGKPDSHIKISSYPVFSSKDEQTVANTLIVLTDITKERLAQQARDDFAAALAHELKTPLHAIGMYAENLLGEECAEEQHRIEFADLITTEVEHLTDLVRNMLSITRIETGNLSISRKTTKLNDLINNIVTTLENTAKDSEVDLITRIPEGLDPVFLDKDLIRIAINNLISNAIKYNRKGGEVKVELKDEESQFQLVVSDTGIGISEEDQQQIFKKFYRSDDDLAREKQGNGLGLSLVHEITNLHGGKLEVESVKNVGSQFTLTLSKSNAPLAEAA